MLNHGNKYRVFIKVAGSTKTIQCMVNLCQPPSSQPFEWLKKIVYPFNLYENMNLGGLVELSYIERNSKGRSSDILWCSRSERLAGSTIATGIDRWTIAGATIAILTIFSESIATNGISEDSGRLIFKAFSIPQYKWDDHAIDWPSFFVESNLPAGNWKVLECKNCWSARGFRFFLRFRVQKDNMPLDALHNYMPFAPICADWFFNGVKGMHLSKEIHLLGKTQDLHMQRVCFWRKLVSLPLVPSWCV